jgi:hypothetical protein
LIGVTCETTTSVCPAYADTRRSRAARTRANVAVNDSPPGGATSGLASQAAISSGQRCAISPNVEPSQSPKSVSIYMEDDHAGGGNRVVRLDGQHPPPSVKLYLGDSRGRWEGNTLVVETTNFSQGFRGSNVDTYKMTERYTRVDNNNLRREITFEDPKTWSRPWTVLIDMGKTSDSKHMIFESACHEGNYGMTGIRVGARRDEEAAAKK